jgi:hypothetical protein
MDKIESVDVYQTLLLIAACDRAGPQLDDCPTQEYLCQDALGPITQGARDALLTFLHLQPSLRHWLWRR